MLANSINDDESENGDRKDEDRVSTRDKLKQALSSHIWFVLSSYNLYRIFSSTLGPASPSEFFCSQTFASTPFVTGARELDQNHQI